MHTTRAFKNGNSQAVRIPADLAYERTDMDLEIEREGDEIRIRPARRSLAGVLTKFGQFSQGSWQKVEAIKNKQKGMRCNASLHT